ncbi:hypothetical protein GG804_00510 [Sphingomonas histidinilytica]|jgi:hypothetical protein|uniref:Flagellar protein FliT n=1 Tax=Rhizorhabdus histidinilytica TaxID=439228 RepID=A0A1T5C064_9SPHN|nr:hypothetical protein [Rhizorhabdus histidinilytica]MBO9375237.1 hypothetical protein [Rhizorhabdus histidinilytica]QEH77385.1 hypothetical protein EIK56_04070 [Sphingomonas sp. C8-2]SKB52643.1 hypothetical protein SAMN06295920_103430 [Rhizorhabdus histidinilytica]
MTNPVVEALIVSSEALIAALDTHDIDAIEAALPALARSVEALDTLDRRTLSPELRARLEEAMRIADGARARVRYLVDRTRQRIDLLAMAAGRFDCTPATYGRPDR